MTSGLADSSRAQQLAKALRQGIQRGEWPVGGALPTARQLARKHRVGSVTVQSVLQELEAQGLIERRPRQGTVVKARTPQVAVGDPRLQQVAIVGLRAGQEPGSWGYRVEHAVEEALWEQGLQATQLRYDLDRADVADELAGRIEAMGAGLVGVIVFNDPLLSGLPVLLDRIGMPWVSVNRMAADQAYNFVAADNLVGCRVVGECLARLGHHRVLVLMVAGVSHSETESEKITGLLHGFLHADAPIKGIEYVHGISYDDMANRAFECTGRHLREQGPPDAVFVLTDEMASGAIAACVEAGLRVPEDVKVVGAAGLELARHTRPRLSVITQPMEAMGQQACAMIQEMIAHNTRRIAPRRIRGRFIVRESLPVPEAVLVELERRFPEMIERDPAAAEASGR